MIKKKLYENNKQFEIKIFSMKKITVVYDGKKLSLVTLTDSR